MISVVLPLYNKELQIAKAIESVLQQTVKPHEIIVIDDGSTDGGGAIARGFESRGVQYVYQDNHGVSAARNSGIKLAESEYIAFLDADDWWLPNHIEVLLNLIQAHPKANLYSTAYYIMRNNKYYRPRSKYINDWLGPVENFFSDYAVGLSLVSSITACAPRSDLIAIGGFPQSVEQGEDIICWARLSLLGLVAHAEIPTAVYFQDANNRSHKKTTVEAPGSICFLAQLIESKRLNRVQYNGAVLLFDRIAFYTAAFFILDKNYITANEIYWIAVGLGRHKLAISIKALMFVPGWLLALMRKLRHPKIKSPITD